ncbi:MAG: SRPBCC family protein [Acidobacteriota bacterium]|nr:Rieske 2Fe-2S domain-containing protein [Blastocatellia bacterium]MDW8239796.1 SRPBCC family protein [Acidobacteriota bacterium]
MQPDDFVFDEQLATALTLPSHWYVDPTMLEREMSHIFARTWQLVGHHERVNAPGDYFTTTVANEPIIVVRGADGQLRALSNVCRHRAGPVARAEGHCKAFQCGYHGWTYSLDGRLLGTPEFDGVQHFNKEAFGLPAFRIETWNGLVFVNLDPEALPLAHTLEDLPAQLGHTDLAQMTLAARRDWYIECNWKVYVDNYLEGYHIPIVHPSLMQQLDYAQYRTETKSYYSIQHAPIKPTNKPRLRRGDSDAESQARYFWVFPNLMLNVYPDNYSTNLIVPLGPERTLTVFEWYFLNPERPDVQQRIQETVAFSDEIQVEDIAICEAVQRGLRSRTYRSGRYSVKRENGVHHFHGLLVQYLQAASRPSLTDQSQQNG